jgi:hypothetical protein
MTNQALTKFTEAVKRIWDGPYSINIDGNVVSLKLTPKLEPRSSGALFSPGRDQEYDMALNAVVKAQSQIKAWIDANIETEDSWTNNEGLGFVSDQFLGTTVKNTTYGFKDWKRHQMHSFQRKHGQLWRGSRIGGSAVKAKNAILGPGYGYPMGTESNMNVDARCNENNEHKLQIKSLHDADASCSCGKWSYVRTGAIERQELVKAHRRHVNSVIMKQNLDFNKRRGNRSFPPLESKMKDLKKFGEFSMIESKGGFDNIIKNIKSKNKITRIPISKEVFDLWRNETFDIDDVEGIESKFAPVLETFIAVDEHGSYAVWTTNAKYAKDTLILDIESYIKAMNKGIVIVPIRFNAAYDGIKANDLNRRDVGFVSSSLSPWITFSDDAPWSFVLDRVRPGVQAKSNYIFDYKSGKHVKNAVLAMKQDVDSVMAKVSNLNLSMKQRKQGIDDANIIKAAEDIDGPFTVGEITSALKISDIPNVNKIVNDALIKAGYKSRWAGMSKVWFK